MIDEPVSRTEPRIVEVFNELDGFRARQSAVRLAATLGFGKVGIHRLATAVSELANNLVFHSDKGGLIHILPLARDGRPGVEVRAEDHGPGIVDLDLAMTDGFSTNGGLGCGLPGCRRLADEFEISSCLHQGTKVVIRLWR